MESISELTVNKRDLRSITVVLYFAFSTENKKAGL